jgi:hypothetical protein
MNATDAYLTDVKETREFLLAVIAFTIMAVGAIIFFFNGIHESPDPCDHVMSRLDIVVRYWPLLILMTILYSVYQVFAFIALHTCCKPQQPVIIAHPLKPLETIP